MDARCRAWTYRRGPSWYVGWYDLDRRQHRKSCGKSREAADRLRDQITQQLRQEAGQSSWSSFRIRLAAAVGGEAHSEILDRVMRHVERLVSPRTAAIDVDRYVELRTAEGIRPATLNKELRYIRLAGNWAVEWGLLDRPPKLRKRFARDVDRLPRVMPDEVFRAIYTTCGHSAPFPSSHWWQTLLVFAYTTGWRIGELLSLEWQDVDLQRGTAITRDNKGRREEVIGLPPVLVSHLRELPTHTRRPLEWPRTRRSLYREYHAIQQEAGVVGRMWGFHDIRRAFATHNAGRMHPDELQRLMRHRSYTTTQGYIAMVDRLKAVGDAVYVPAFLTDH